MREIVYHPSLSLFRSTSIQCRIHIMHTLVISLPFFSAYPIGLRVSHKEIKEGRNMLLNQNLSHICI